MQELDLFNDLAQHPRTWLFCASRQNSQIDLKNREDFDDYGEDRIKKLR